MKTFTPDEIKKESKKIGYKHAALFDSAGKQVMGFNQVKDPIDGQLVKIFKRLESKTLANGVYTIRCKNSLRQNAPTDDYPILKADGLGDNSIFNTNGNQTPTLVIKEVAAAPAGANEHVLTWTSALELNTKLLRAEMDVTRLQGEVDRLTMENDTLKREQTLQDDDKGGFAENAKNFLADLMPTAAPLLDQFFQQRGKKLDIEERRLQLEIERRKQQPAAYYPPPQYPPQYQGAEYYAPQQPAARQPQPAEQPAPDLAAEFVQAYAEDNPNDILIPALSDAYNNAQSFDEFMAALNVIKVPEEMLAEGEEQVDMIQLFNDFCYG